MLSKNQKRNFRRKNRRQEAATTVQCASCYAHLGRMAMERIAKKYSEYKLAHCAETKQKVAWVDEMHCPHCNRADLRCPVGHFTWVTPRQARETYSVNVAIGASAAIPCDLCSFCEAVPEKDRPDNWVEYTFRPDQKTRVVLHHVYFQWKQYGQLVTAAASFQGSVVDATDGALVVQLIPRDDLDFRYVSPCPLSSYVPASGVRLRRDDDSKLLIVVLDNDKITPDSLYIVAGGHCKSTRCKPDCMRHDLGKVQEFEILKTFQKKKL